MSKPCCSRWSSRCSLVRVDACRDNHLALVKYLIEIKDCDINQLTTSFETSLHGAILGAVENRYDTASNNEKRHQIVEYLLGRSDCNPNLGRTDCFGHSDLLERISIGLGLNPLCASLDHDRIYDYTSLLIEHKCNVDRLGWNRYEISHTVKHKSDCHLLYPLDHPLNICLRRLCTPNDSRLVNDYFTYRKHALNLIKAHCNVYAMYDYGSTYPLSLAIQTGDRLIVETMLTEAAGQIRVDLVEPLIQAAKKSHCDIVQNLVDFGFNPNTIMIDRDLTRLRNRKIPFCSTSICMGE